MAKLTIRWTRQAIADVDHIYDFIAASNPAAARAIAPSMAWCHIPESGEKVA
jgi:plasmid stabilization system protein ParE